LEIFMEREPALETNSNSLKSSLDPSVTNTIETPEPQPDEYSDDFEADPAVPDSIDPELINTPGLNPEDEEETPGGADPGLDPEDLPDSVKPDADLPTPDDVIREEIVAGGRDRNSISNPDAGI
jgi:hypothetical protein